MKFKNLCALILVCIVSSSFKKSAHAADPLVGLSTSGTVQEIDFNTGALSTVVDEQITSFTLGAIARKKDVLHYVAAPSGSSENAIYTVNLKTKIISHVDLDRGDDARLLFFKGKKLFVLFYNGSTGDLGLYRVAPATGVTTLVRDYSDLAVEPVGGAISQIGEFFFTIVKPGGDGSRRSLMRFQAKNKAPQLTEIVSAAGAPVLCDRLKPSAKATAFVCLASPSTMQVDVCKLTLKGKANCTATLAGIERVAGGHTLATTNGKTFYALVYALGDGNSQRLLKLNAKGVVKNTATVNNILVGIRFGLESDEIESVS